jgi:hypothetical protein
MSSNMTAEMKRYWDQYIHQDHDPSAAENKQCWKHGRPAFTVPVRSISVVVQDPRDNGGFFTRW